MGEDNNKKIHLMATMTYRRNCITTLKDEAGREISNHEEMAGIRWASYKNRMGASEPIQMQFDLEQLLVRVEGLEALSNPSEEKQMDEVIKHIPANKA